MRVHITIWGLFCLLAACSQPESPTNPPTASPDIDAAGDVGDAAEQNPNSDMPRDAAPNGRDTDAYDARPSDVADAAQVDDGGDLPPTDICLRGSTILCDGFETLDGWTIDEHFGSVLPSAEPDPVFRGTHALYTNVFTASGYATVETDIPALELEQQVWLRFWMYYPSSNNLQNGIEVVQLLNDDEQSLVFFVDEGEVDTHAHLTAGSFEFDHFEGFPEDTWVCVEWGIRLSETNASIEVALDGVTIIAEDGLALQAASAFNKLKVGTVTPQTQFFATTFYFDELFVGESRAGCE